MWEGLGRKVRFLFYGVVVLQGLRTHAVSEVQCVYSSAIFIAQRRASFRLNALCTFTQAWLLLLSDVNNRRYFEITGAVYMSL